MDIFLQNWVIDFVMKLCWSVLQIYAYGRSSNLSKMFEKAKLCREILKLYDIVSPGKSKERALTQFELYFAEKQILKQDFDIFLKNPSDDVMEDLIARVKSSQEFLCQGSTL